jgi:hypothetical protein
MAIEKIIILFILWNAIGIFILGFSARIGYAIEVQRLNPIHIYKDRRVNWFGCFWLTLMFNLLCPVLTFSYWFYKLCTVGRKYDGVSDNYTVKVKRKIRRSGDDTL